MSLGYTRSVFAPGVPEGPIHGSNGTTLVPSSFGAEHTTFGPSFSAHAAIGEERCRTLAYREAFYRCTHHDQKIFDWQGRVLHRPGELSHQPLIGLSLPTQYVPLDMRRPNDPYRLARLVVSAFTAMVFGEGLFPEINVPGDAAAQDFARELSRAQALPGAMIRARDVGGSTGTVGLSWRFSDGRPRVAVHRPQFLHVVEWADYERSEPAHVVRLTQAWRPVVLRDGRRTQMLFWQRRDWTPDEDVVYREEPVDPKEEPFWRIDEEQTVEHGDGFCHFVWIRNLEDTEESSIDGLPDYDAIYENMSTLDVLSSVVTRGGVLNLDPTLKLKMDPDILARFGAVSKGSDNAINVGLDGDASYMELDGTSLQTGTGLVGSRRAHALEVVQCVVPNPDEVAAAGTTGVGLQRLYRPMLSKAGLMRASYGAGVRKLLEQQLASARGLARESVAASGRIEREADKPAADAEETRIVEEQELDSQETRGSAAKREAPALALAPRVVEEQEFDSQGRETGSVVVTFEERDPGDGGQVELEWPDYFAPTPDDRQKEISSLSLAAGGRPIISHRTAVEKAARVVGAEPIQEWRRVSEQLAADRLGESSMFPPTGGEVLGPEQAADEAAEAPGAADPSERPSAQEGAVAAQESTAAPEELSRPGPSQIVRLSPDFVPNGAQIAAAVDIVKAVKTGDLPRDAGLGLLEVMFNLNPAAALKLMGSAGVASSGDGIPASIKNDSND